VQTSFKKNMRRFPAALSMMVMMFLTGCEEKHQPINSCPSWPEPKPSVADELEKYCYPKNPRTDKRLIKCPSTHEWLNRLFQLEDKLKRYQQSDQLEREEDLEK
jgi:ribosomal protein L32